MNESVKVSVLHLLELCFGKSPMLDILDSQSNKQQEVVPTSCLNFCLACRQVETFNGGGGGEEIRGELRGYRYFDLSCRCITHMDLVLSEPALPDALNDKRCAL